MLELIAALLAVSLGVVAALYVVRMRASKRRLAVAEERFRLSANAVSDAIYDWDLLANTIWRSDSAATLFGLHPGDADARVGDWHERVHPEDKARVMDALNAALADPDCDEWSADYRFQHGDGHWLPVHERATVVRDDAGKAVRVVGGMSDATRESLDASQVELLKLALAATPTGIVIMDAHRDGRPIVFANAGLQAITGYNEAELVAGGIDLIYGPNKAQPGIEALAHALAEQREGQALLQSVRKNGETYWAEVVLSPIGDGDGGISHFVGAFVDVSDRIATEQALAHRATHDELTGLPNRQVFKDRLTQSLRESKRFGMDVVVMFVDLDNFKLVNDSLGHAAGDELLRTVSRRLQGCVRQTDTVARFGGDEFVVLLIGDGETDMIRVIDRTTESLRRPVELAGQMHYCTASMGYARFPQDGDDVGTLLQRADVAMYQAKARGRNCAVGYSPEFDKGISDRLTLINQLREALQRNEFTLYYQPQVRWDGRVRGMEALIRWNHPTRGLLAPGHFIDALEESGLMVEVGRWVLQEAASQFIKLVDAGLGDLRISINVSATQLHHNLVADVDAAVKHNHLPDGALELELTESVLMINADAIIEEMKRLSKLGVGIAVDDFGTGYSSLAYLKRLPIQRLKIDRSFIMGLGSDPDDEAICASVILLASSLGLDTVAEGVENEAQRDWLAEHGCGEMQGYLLGKPMPFDDLLSTVRASRGM